MAAPNEDLWPDDIRVDVLSPLQIMRVQEGLLQKRLQGVVEAQVTTTRTDALVRHEFDLFARWLGYRERIFSATHAPNRPYPVTVEAECFRKEAEEHYDSIAEENSDGYERPEEDRKAATEEEFVKLIREVLRSTEVRSLIQSLVAQSNEIRPGAAPAG